MQCNFLIEILCYFLCITQYSSHMALRHKTLVIHGRKYWEKQFPNAPDAIVKSSLHFHKVIFLKYLYWTAYSAILFRLLLIYFQITLWEWLYNFILIVNLFLINLRVCQVKQMDKQQENVVNTVSQQRD